MPTKYKDYPIYSYDEPSIHSDFSGGINTDPSNEHLLENEMRDCINMDYLSGALVKRKGAELLSNISCEEDLTNIQGIFLYTYKLTYLIIAANGKLYYGIYNEGITINLERLYIEQAIGQTDKLYNPLDTLDGIIEYNLGIEGKHDGYKQSYYTNEDGSIKLLSNYRGNYTEIESGAFNKGDIVNWIQNGVLRQYICIQDFEKVVIKPTNSTYWQELDLSEVDLTSPISQWTSLKIEYPKDTIVLYDTHYYKSLSTHYNFATLPNIENCESTTLQERFRCIDPDMLQGWTKLTYLVFQNYRPIECASINNNLIVATGTRLVEIYPSNNYLKAKPITPYLINNSELLNIGVNYLSPYPELAIASQKDTVSTQVYSVKVEKLRGGMFKLSPILSVAQGDSLSSYKFRWEKLINGVWYCVKTFKSQFPQYLANTDGSLNILRTDNLNYELEVSDADIYQYRVTMAKYFDMPIDLVNSSDFDITSDYSIGDIVYYNGTYYKCLRTYNALTVVYDNNEFNVTARFGYYSEENQWVIDPVYKLVWEAIYTTEPILKLNTNTDIIYYPDQYPDYWQSRSDFSDARPTRPQNNYEEWVKDYNTLYSVGTQVVYKSYNPSTQSFQWRIYECITQHFSAVKSLTYTSDTDYKINSTLEVGNNSAVSTLFNNSIDIEDTFKVINSCTKILADGYKLILYDDNYNSGMWYKSIISNPYYISDRGNLSFKTKKNERVIKVIPFQGNLIVFANAENVGGSIHIVSGNGDDYNSNDGYYSPYQRRTINSSISCDNPNTIQVCDNILVFKYFNRIYYINASDLDNEVVKVTPCNDRVLSKNTNVAIPWEDNNCISVVTKDYYALIWKEKYTIDDNNELILEHPGMRVKMYYKLASQINDNSYAMPWLRDESEYFNVDYILYIKGNPIYLYHNLLLNFNGSTYEDLNKEVTTKIILRGYDLEYPKLIKLIHSVILYYHRNQASQVKIQVIVRNEAGHILINADDNKASTQELRVLFANKEKHLATNLRLDTTIQDTKVINASYAFPALLADAEIIATNKGEFSLSSITFTYTTCESPDTTQFDLYNSIIRPQDIKGGIK